jgi:GNAT superfamily N-acetyltransferase
MIELAPVTGGADLDEVRRLFREYADGLGVDLCFQGFEGELAGLPGDYAQPTGTLVIARVDGAPAGCVAAHRWEADSCEMKRLYVRSAFRGSGCGRALVEHVLGWARAGGYRRVVLDTLPSMGDAQRMYARYGFREIAPYRANPVPGARYLALDLDG